MIVMTSSEAEIASRVRAALAYANIYAKDSEEEVGISPATMARIISPTAPRGASLDELRMVAGACGVPLWFLEYGWSPPVKTGEEEMRERMADIEAAVRALGATVPPRPGWLPPREREARRPKPRTPPLGGGRRPPGEDPPQAAAR